jgi:Cys-tRNA(Pro)/Cys-tRNA(Cys) deacylase
MTPAIDEARRAHIEYHVIEVKVDPELSYGEAVAAALGADPTRVYKTLIAKLDTGRLVVALVPVAAELNLKALASLAGAKRAEMATPLEAERSTGYVVGGISPLGQRRRLPTFADARLEAHPSVFVSAGRRGLELELTPTDLVALCDATLGEIAR